MMRILRLAGRWFWLGAVLALAVLLVTYGGSLATRSSMDEAYQRGQTTLRLAVSALRGHINRFEQLPALIAEQENVKELVVDPKNAAKVAGVNDYLKEINTLLESSDVFLVMPDGETVAASNFDRKTSFVGQNFVYRPYVQDALLGKKGRFFAIGTTSLRRGYFFSSPVYVDGAIRAVMVFKVETDPIEASWQGAEDRIIVTDPEGIIFMSGRPTWLYAGLLPLTEERLATTRQSRRYADTTLRELPATKGSFNQSLPLLTVTESGKRTEYLDVYENMEDAGWTVHVLVDSASARSQALTVVIASLMMLGLAALVATIVAQRRARLAERMEIQRSAQNELEMRVEERTADLALANQRLAEEVIERRVTEDRLRQTQSDLIQAGKLAALGQMSAALSHEFNQPLAAVKTYAGNAAELLRRERYEDAGDNVSRIAAMADRMASISRHLRNFARKPNDQLGPVSLGEVIESALEIVHARLKTADAHVEVEIGNPPPVVVADTIRLQQVLVNLISNAADSIQGRSNRTIDIAAETIGDRIVVTVRDHGPGVPDAIKPRIFDPFFSTKGVGKGLGLGLSISYNIVEDFGGKLSVSDADGGGAIFMIELGLAGEMHREAAE